MGAVLSAISDTVARANGRLVAIQTPTEPG